MPTLADLFVYFKGDDSHLEKSFDKAEGRTNSFATNATKMIGGAVVGAAVAAGAAILAVGKGALDVSVETEAAANQMAASLGVPIDEAERFADVAKRVYGNNFADSVGDAATAVEGLAKQLGLTADDPALQTMAENAFRLRDVFGVDVNDSINAVKTLTENFGISSGEAFDMIAAGYQRGLDSSGDFLDTIGEYSTQFANGGADAGQFFSLLESGLQGGMLGTDKAADAFKEFRVRIGDGSQTTADALAQIGINVDDVTAAMSDGTMSAADAFTLVQGALAATTDPVTRMQAGVGLLGTQYEDLGDAAAGALTLTNDWKTGTEGAITTLDEKYNTFGSAVEGIWRRVTVSVSPFTDKLMELVNEAMPAVMGAFDDFDAAVGPVMTSIGNAINTTVDFVKGLFAGWRTSVDTDAVGPLDYWKGWVDTNLPMLQTLFQNVLSAVQGFWTLFGDDIMRIVDNTFNTIWTTIDTVLRTVGDLITLFLQVLTGDWEGAGETLKGIVQRLWDALYEIVSTQLDSLQTLFTAIDWAELGKNIIEGVARGISNAAGKIATAATNAAKDAYEAAKNWLGISSPSKKTEKEIGVPFAEGIGKGIESQMRGLAGTVNGGLGSLMGSVQTPSLAGAGGMTITVNVSGDHATYESGRAVGRGVLDELRRRGR